MIKTLSFILSTLILIDFLNPWQKDLAPYSLYVQKQPGFWPENIEFNFIFSDDYDKAWVYPKNSKLSSKNIFNKDVYKAVLLYKK